MSRGGGKEPDFVSPGFRRRVRCGSSRCRRASAKGFVNVPPKRDDRPVAIEIPGQQIEDYARHLAGDLGIRDFVYEPLLVPKGKGVREISDGMLVAGQNGLIVQVKSRDPEAAKADPPEKAEAWCVKNAAAAVRQADGTRRSLATGPVTVRSLRGFERVLPDASGWPSVIIVDHPRDPQVDLPDAAQTFYVSLNDWLNLHRWLRSTFGVISYVCRAIDSGMTVLLGREIERYEALASADLHASGSLTSFPTLPPYQIAGAEARAAALFEDLIERLADPEGASGWDAEQYLLIVEELDRVPPIARVRIGAKMRATFLEMVNARSRRSFMVADPSNPRVRIAFLYEFDTSNDQPSGWFMARTAAYGIMRNQHAVEAGADPTSITLAIGILHHPDLGRRYAFFYAGGTGVALPTALRLELEAEFGVFDGASVQGV